MRDRRRREGVQAVGADVGARGDVDVAEDRDRGRGEALDDLHHDRSHASVGVTLAGGDDAGFASGSVVLVALAAEIDVIGLDRWTGAAAGRRGAQRVTLAALGHGVAQPLMQIPGGG